MNNDNKQNRASIGSDDYIDPYQLSGSREDYGQSSTQPQTKQDYTTSSIVQNDVNTPTQLNSIGQIPSIQPTANNSTSIKVKKEKGILSLFLTLIAALALVQIINIFFFQSYKVFGSSMAPTLHDGDRLIISKIGKTTAKLQGKIYEPSRGDIIIFSDPRQHETKLIKRVIGLPGERVTVKDGTITVYNTKYPGGFNPDSSGIYNVNFPEISGDVDVKVPSGNLFVSGDNRHGGNSLDSRNELGTIPESLVVGKLELRLWPLSDAGFF